jgi:hypothetical protein
MVVSLFVVYATRELGFRPWMVGAVLLAGGCGAEGVKPIDVLAGGVLGTTLGLRPALAVAAVGATTTVLWTWLSPLRSRPGLGADAETG